MADIAPGGDWRLFPVDAPPELGAQDLEVGSLSRTQEFESVRTAFDLGDLAMIERRSLLAIERQHNVLVRGDELHGNLGVGGKHEGPIRQAVGADGADHHGVHLGHDQWTASG